MAVNTAERCLNRVTPGGQACKKLQEAFAHAGQTNLLPMALIGERAIMIPAFRLSVDEMEQFGKDEQAGGNPGKPRHFSGIPQRFLWFTGFFERDLAYYLQIMDKSISLVALPPPQSLAHANDLSSASDIAKKRMYTMSSMILPALRQAILREATAQANIKLATTALTVERFRLDQGRLPIDLKELTPRFLDAIPTDPFDGAPLRYRRLDRGYVVYNVGEDGRDDGGREPPEHKKPNDNSTYDLTFVVQH
jgi:hypothetical protein